LLGNPQAIAGLWITERAFSRQGIVTTPSQDQHQLNVTESGGVSNGCVTSSIAAPRHSMRAIPA